MIIEAQNSSSCHSSILIQNYSRIKITLEHQKNQKFLIKSGACLLSSAELGKRKVSKTVTPAIMLSPIWVLSPSLPCKRARKVKITDAELHSFWLKGIFLLLWIPWGDTNSHVITCIFGNWLLNYDFRDSISSRRTRRQQKHELVFEIMP